MQVHPGSIGRQSASHNNSSVLKLVVDRILKISILNAMTADLADMPWKAFSNYVRSN